jgi:deoxyadenosine/deoxycytidine kinase
MYLFLCRLLYSTLSPVYHLFFPKTSWFIIEGNIGCGKSTVLLLLQNEKNVEVIQEPVDVWKNIEDETGENILGLFYKNPQRYAYLFQTIVFKSRMMALEPMQRQPIRVSERSIWTDKHIFSESCYEMGHMNTIEKSSYDLWFDWLEEKITRKPDGIIYLRAAPDLCLDRVRQRDRLEESSVSLDYLTVIHNKHDEWLMQQPLYKGIPIYVIDNTQDPVMSLQKVRLIINK